MKSFRIFSFLPIISLGLNLFFFPLSSSVQAQTPQDTDTLFDVKILVSTNGCPVSGALVSLRSEKDTFEQKADVSGACYFSDIPANEYRMKIFLAFHRTANAWHQIYSDTTLQAPVLIENVATPGGYATLKGMSGYIKWYPLPENEFNVQGYAIWYNDEILTTVGKNTTEYRIPNLSFGLHKMGFHAIFQSRTSDTLISTLSLEPAAPANLDYRRQGNHIELFWTPKEEFTPLFYQIYLDNKLLDPQWYDNTYSLDALSFGDHWAEVAAVYADSLVSPRAGIGFNIFNYTMNRPDEICLNGPFPNPCRNAFSFQASQAGTLELYTSQGKLCKCLTFSRPDRYEIDVQELRPGLYFLKFIHAGGTAAMEKLIITK